MTVPIVSPMIRQYLQYLAGVRAYSRHTTTAYARDLAVLASLARDIDATGALPLTARERESTRNPAPGDAPDRCGHNAAGHPEPDWARIDQHCLRRWIAAAARSGLSARTIARRLSAWRSFFDWLAATGILAANPARGLRAPRAPRRLPKALSPEMATRLVQPAATGPGPCGLDSPAQPEARGRGQRRRSGSASFVAARDDAIAELFYSSGLRLSELVSLDMRYFAAPAPPSSAWLDLAEAEAIVHGKGGRRRAVPVGSAARVALKRWLDVRAHWCRQHPGGDERALFLGASGARISNRTVQWRLRQRAIERGIPANVHPHVLRHSFASHLLQSSGDLRAVQELLGHASISTTQMYTALDFQRLAMVYGTAHPRARRDRDADARDG